MIIWQCATVSHLRYVALATRRLTIVQAKTKYHFLHNLRREYRTNSADNHKGASTLTVNLTLLIRCKYICEIPQEIKRIINSGGMSYIIVSRNGHIRKYYKKS